VGVLFFAPLSVAAALAAVTVGANPAPPERPGPWKQLGPAVVSSKKPISYLRTAARSPKALAFVVTGPPGRRLRVSWATLCEIFDDDTGYENRQGTSIGTRRVVGYLTVLTDSTHCFVTVRVTPPAGARVTAATFAY
jgi:hypothetical protein